MKKSTQILIDKFLAERRKFQRGEYSPVMDEDLELFSQVIDTLISDKWQSDLDMDYPIEVEIVNRHTHGRMHYRPVPYLHKCRTEKDYVAHINAVMGNLSTASEQVRYMADITARYMDVARKAESHDDL